MSSGQSLRPTSEPFILQRLFVAALRPNSYFVARLAVKTAVNSPSPRSAPRVAKAPAISGSGKPSSYPFHYPPSQLDETASHEGLPQSLRVQIFQLPQYKHPSSRTNTQAVRRRQAPHVVWRPQSGRPNRSRRHPSSLVGSSLPCRQQTGLRSPQRTDDLPPPKPGIPQRPELRR